MIEAIILSTFSLLVGGLVGALIGASLLEYRVKKVTQKSGNKIYMWKGFVDPTCVFITSETSEDGVVFDKNGNIISVHSHVKTR